MPVYPAAARNASTSRASPGCWCRDRVPRYPSDLTDAQWAVLEPRARAVMKDLESEGLAVKPSFCALPGLDGQDDRSRFAAFCEPFEP
jgi:hypothetical protein